MITSDSGEFIRRDGASLSFEYDPIRDVLKIAGTVYAADLFRVLGTDGFEEGAVLRIERREPEGVVLLKRLNNVEEFLEGIKST